MHVVHVIPTVARRAGGPSEVIRSLLPQLEAHGITTTLVTTDKGNTHLDADLAERANVYIARSVGPPRWTFSPGLVRRLWREIGKSDLVHVHSVHTFPTTAALLIAVMRGRPAVIQPHGALNRYHMAQRRLLKMAYLRLVDFVGLRAVRAAIYSSTVEARDGGKVLRGVPGWYLPLGVDEEILAVDRQQFQIPRVLFLGRVAQKKRVDLLLASVADHSLDGLRFELVIAGPFDGDLSYDPQALAKELGLAQRVRFVGAVDHAERVALLAGADIFVLPSDDESFGMAVAEAMGAGCAVICTPEVGVARDAVSAAATVLIEQSPAAIAVEIRRLILNPSLSSQLGGRARTYARASLSWTRIGAQLAQRYSTLVSQASPHGSSPVR